VLETTPPVFLENGIFYQKNFPRSQSFEKTYLELRSTENRVYSDQIVAQLPFADAKQVNKDEWKARSCALKRLIAYLQKKSNPGKILELGSGNGWLSKNLADSLSTSSVVAMDVNENELLQGRRVFKHVQNLEFIYGDIFSYPFETNFDIIVLAGTIPYIEDLQSLLRRLLNLLSPTGEMHILDSPIYTANQLEGAKERTNRYFNTKECPHMKSFFHHHTWESLSPFTYQILYNPTTISKRVIRFINKDTPFPWIKILNT